MSAESIKENAIRKIIQELIVPDLKEIKGKVTVLEERINSTKNELKADISSVKNELKADIGRLEGRIDSLDEKVDSVKNELKADIGRLDDRIDSLDEKMDTKITALSEKVDYMNRFNEKLFNLIHPVEQK